MCMRQQQGDRDGTDACTRALHRQSTQAGTQPCRPVAGNMLISVATPSSTATQDLHAKEEQR